MESFEVNLDSLNEKQRSKEFKTVSKEIKSKDPSVRSRALNKLKDVRYMTIGPCFAAVIESLTPKKVFVAFRTIINDVSHCKPFNASVIHVPQKMLDLSKQSISALLSFLGDVKFAGSDRASDFQQALHMLINVAGGCNHIQILTDLVAFKEEVKKVKVKKGETPPPVVENEDVVYLRSRAIEAVCCITTLLSTPNAEDRTLQEAFSSIPQFTYNLCTVIVWLADRYRDESSREGMLQEAIWALASLSFVLRHNPQSASIFLSFDLGDIVKCIADMTPEKCLSLFCLDIFEMLSRIPAGLQRITGEEIVVRLAEMVEVSSETLSQIAVPTPTPAAGAGGKGVAAAKKEEKPKKGAKAPAAETDNTDKRLIGDPKRLFLAYLKLLADTFTAISRFSADIITAELTTRLVTSFSKALLNNALWDVARVANESPFAVPLGDTFVRICILFGAIGVTNAPQRKAAVSAGAARTLLTVLQQSRAVVFGDSAVGSDSGLASLRRVAEQAILCVLTKPFSEAARADGESKEEASSELSSETRRTAKQRWLSSCTKYITKRFERSDEPESLPPFSVPQLLEVIGAAGDLDLGTRGLRILAALLQGVEDLHSFLQELNLDAAAVGIICAAVQARGVALLGALDKEEAQAAEAAAALAAAAGSVVSTEEAKTNSEDGGAAVAGSSEQEATGSSQEELVAPKVEVAVDLLLPNEREALLMALIVLEPLLATSTANINIFTTKERLTTFASLLYRCGPSGNKSFFLPEVEGQESGQKPAVEIEVSLHDPRNFSNLPTAGESDGDLVLLRPLLFDVLAIVASADAKNRKYEGDVPPEASKPLPPSTSACGDAPVAVAKICGDACIAALSYGTTYATVEGNVTAVPAEVTLHTQVLDSAIGLLIGMASCGASGMYGLLECVAEAGFRDHSSTSVPESALQGLKEFLNTVSTGLLQECESQTGEGSTEASVSEEIEHFKKIAAGPYAWARTLLFDQLFPDESSILTSKKRLLATPIIWPYVTVCASILAVIASPDANSQTAALSMDAIELLCRVPMFPFEGQPVVADIFAAVMLSLGGGAYIASALGRFGTLDPRSRESATNFANYLITRGRIREEFWAERARKLAESAPVDGKGKKKDEKKKEEKKKDTKKDPKKDAQAAAAQAGMTVAEVQYNYEPDGTHPDPNHGPTRAYWTLLLSIASDDMHAFTPTSTALSAAVQGGATEVAVSLINEHAAIDKVDGKGIAPLMYALVLSNEIVASALVAAHADLDVIDASGNPALKYACLSLSPEDIENTFVGHLTVPKASAKASLLGSTSLLNMLLDAGVDTLVADKAGNSPLLWSLGLGVLALDLGGYPLTVSNSSYSSGYPLSSTYSAVESLIRHGASINACNRQGVVALHVSAARGDIEVINLLQESGAIANAADTGGFLPLHYAAAACPPDAPAVFDFLINFAKERPIEQMVFNDTRTGLTSSDKYDQDVAEVMTKVFGECLSPTIITLHRKHEVDLMAVISNDGLNVLQLCMTAHALQLERFSPFICGGKYERMELALHLYSKHDGEKANLFRNIDSYGMTALHAASLLFEGVTPRVELTDQEKRSKRVKKYPSSELHILDIIFTTTPFDADGVCTRPVPSKKIPRKFPWTPLHGAIASNNMDLVSELVRVKKADISHFPYIHFMAERDAADISICEFIVSTAASTSGYNVLLNAPASGCATPIFGRPLHIAVRCRSISCISGLVHCARVNPNVVDESSGKTAFHEACSSGDMELIRTFSPLSDRLDLLVEDKDGRTCIEAALEGPNAIEIVTILLDMRKNDVLGRLTKGVGEGDAATSILKQLEEQNMALVKTLGLDKPQVVAVSQSAQVEDVQVGELAQQLDESSLQDKIDDHQNDPDHEAQAESKAADGAEELGEEFESMTLAKEADDEAKLADDVVSSLVETVDVATVNGRDEIVVTEEEPVQPSTAPLSAAEVEAASAALKQSDELLLVLLPVLLKAGVVAESMHAHPCFAKGILYRQFCNPE